MSRPSHARSPAIYSPRALVDRGYRALGHAMTLDVARLMRLPASKMHLPKIDLDFDFRFLTPDEVAAYALDPMNEMHLSFAGRMSSGRDLCCAALLDDQLAGYIWLALGSLEAEQNRGRSTRSGVAVSFPRSAAFVYKAFVRSEFRGRHLYPACLAHGLEGLKPRGVSQLLTTAEWNNRAALAACRQLGFHDVGTILRVACGPISFTVTPARARLHGIMLGRHARVHPRVARHGSPPAAAAGRETVEAATPATPDTSATLDTPDTPSLLTTAGREA